MRMRLGRRASERHAVGCSEELCRPVPMRMTRTFGLMMLAGCEIWSRCETWRLCLPWPTV